MSEAVARVVKEVLLPFEVDEAVRQCAFNKNGFSSIVVAGQGNIVGDVPVESEEEHARNARYEADVDAKWKAEEAHHPQSGGRGGASSLT